MTGQMPKTKTVPISNGDLTSLTRLMRLSQEVAEFAETLFRTEVAPMGMKLMETADQIAEEVGLIAEQMGYTIDEVTEPLWGRKGTRRG